MFSMGLLTVRNNGFYPKRQFPNFITFVAEEFNDVFQLVLLKALFLSHDNTGTPIEQTFAY